MEKFFAMMIKDVRHERPLQILPSKTDQDTLKQSKLTDHGINVTKNLAGETLHKQRILEENAAVHLLE